MKAMNLRKNKEGHMGGLEERKENRKNMLFRLSFKKKKRKILKIHQKG